MSNIKHFCDYGCGREATHFLKKAKKWCCSKSYNSCSVAKEKNRKAHIGSKNHRYGKKCSEETKQKISKANKGRVPWNKGMTDVYSENTIEKMRQSRIGVLPWNKGLKNTFKHSEEAIEKIRISSTGKKHTEETKQKISKVHKGKSVSKKSRKLMSENHTCVLGSNNPNWKGGVSFEPYCEQWSDKEYKTFIKDRDGNQCLNPTCNKKYKTLSIHHINYNKKDCHPRNLITLCISCNSKANGEREWHEMWYSEIIYKKYGE